MSRCVPWSDEETQTAQQLRQMKVKYRVIAERLNRTVYAVRAHLDRAALSAEERKEYDKRERERFSKRRWEAARLREWRKGERDHVVRSADDPTREQVNRLLDARDRRWAVQARDLTALLMGDPQTSHLAAARNQVERNTHRWIALQAHAAHPDGLIDHELQDITGIAQTSIGKRRRELCDMGYIADSDTTRLNRGGSPCKVWKITRDGVARAAA